MRHAVRMVAGVGTAMALDGFATTAWAEQVGAYVLFEVGGGAPVADVLAHKSLGNCLQLLVGPGMAGDVILHLACDDGAGSTTAEANLTKAILDLSVVEGVQRATLLQLKRQ